MIDQEFVDYLIKIICRNARPDDLGSSVHCLGGNSTREPHLLDDLCRLHVVAGIAFGCRLADIAGPRNAPWHLARR